MDRSTSKIPATVQHTRDTAARCYGTSWQCSLPGDSLQIYKSMHAARRIPGRADASADRPLSTAVAAAQPRRACTVWICCGCLSADSSPALRSEPRPPPSPMLVAQGSLFDCDRLRPTVCIIFPPPRAAIITPFRTSSFPCSAAAARPLSPPPFPLQSLSLSCPPRPRPCHFLGQHTTSRPPHDRRPARKYTVPYVLLAIIQITGEPRACVVFFSPSHHPNLPHASVEFLH